MPLFKFVLGNSVTDRVTGDLVPERPIAFGELVRTGQTIEADLAPEVPLVFCFFGFTLDIAAPNPVAFGYMQDEFFCNLYQEFPIVDGALDSTGVFIGNIRSVYPAVSTGDSFIAGMFSVNPSVDGFFREQQLAAFNDSSAFPVVSGDFLQTSVFFVNIGSCQSVVNGAFYIDNSSFVTSIFANNPVASGIFSVIGQFDFGSEGDAVLNNRSSRRYI